jgi:uncharacterized protein YbbC (DUF1343 family)
MNDMKLGLEVLASNGALAKHWGRCGLLSNQASVDKNFVPAWKLLYDLLGRNLIALFGPQHGFYGTCQDNMIETGHERHAKTGLPIYSLYSDVREPTSAMLADIDTLIIDLQIVGCRIYTWKSTIAGCLRAAKANNKRVVVLDRPNPVGGQIIEGNVLEHNATSFVGEYPIPMRHALSAGEAARFFNDSIGAELLVVPMEYLQPQGLWMDFGRKWVPTSPNLPTEDSVYVYPGTVMLEGTNISEGRGTSMPFQLIGAPYIPDSEDYCSLVIKYLGGKTPGVYLRPTSFQPTFHKWAGQVCNGVNLHVLDPRLIRSFSLTLALINAAMELGGNQFQWKQPPYEYDLTTLPIKLIVGSLDTPSHFGTNFSVADDFWSAGQKSYLASAEKFFLYRRQGQIACG